jgi:hypothetical protein
VRPRLPPMTYEPSRAFAMACQAVSVPSAGIPDAERDEVGEPEGAVENEAAREGDLAPSHWPANLGEDRGPHADGFWPAGDCGRLCGESL